MAHRPDLNTLSANQRTTLVNLMLNYLTDQVVAGRATATNPGELWVPVTSPPPYPDRNK